MEFSHLPPATQFRSNYLPSIASVVVGIGALAGMDAFAKELIERLPVVLFVAIRGWFTVAIMALWIPKAGGLTGLRTERVGGHLFRILVGGAAPLLFFQSLDHLPLADAYVLAFCAPFIMTTLSVILFKDAVGIHRWSSVIIGFVGVTIAMQPGSAAFSSAAFLALGAAFAYAGLMMSGRWLSDTESTFNLVFIYNVGLALVTTIALPFFWQAVSTYEIALIAAMSVLSIGGHLGLTFAFSNAPTGVVAPFEYTALVWAVLLGYFYWDDIPTTPVIIGAAIIVASGIYTIHREAIASNK